MEELLRIIIENEGGSLGAQKEETYPRNVIGKMMEESADDPELVEFLKKFDADKKFSIKDAVKKINDGNGKLSRVESLVLMMDELLVTE
jgi:hypothetical protein